MKNLVFLMLVVISIILLPSCQKDSIDSSSKPIDTKSFSVTVDTVGTSKYGTASPIASTVEKGGSLTINFTAKPGGKMNGLTINGISVNPVSSYTITDIAKDYNFKPSFIPDPLAAVYFSITVDTTGTSKYGTANPILSQVIKGGTLSISFTSKPGCRMNGLMIDNSKVNVVNPYVFTNVQANHPVKPSFTDSLVTKSLDSIRNLLIGTWYDNADSSKLAGMSIENDPFAVIPIPSCAKDIKSVYTAAGTARDYQGANPCDITNKPGAQMSDFTWELSPNGKTISMVDLTGVDTHTTTLVSVTSTTFTYINSYKGIMYKYVAKHTPAK